MPNKKTEGINPVAFRKLKDTSWRLGLSDYIANDAVKIYRECVENKAATGRSIEVLALAAIYAACKQGKIPRRLDEIVGASDLATDSATKKIVFRTYRQMCAGLHLKTPPIDPADYVRPCTKALNRTQAVADKAVSIIKVIEQHSTSLYGKSPQAVAGAAVSIAADSLREHVDPGDVAEVTHSTKPTIVSLCHILRRLETEYS